MPWVRLFLPTALIAVIVLIPAVALTSSTGAPLGRAGDPPFNNTCSASGCHATHTVDSGSGTLSIETPDTYTPGEPVTLRIRVSQAGLQKAGFQVAVKDAADQHAGLLTLLDATASKTADAQGQYVTHSVTGTVPTGDGERVWEVQWSSPDEVGPVTIYASGVAADGNRLASGDHVYTASTTLLPSTTTAVDAHLSDSTGRRNTSYRGRCHG
jgi:hypothetical protein